MVYVSQPLSILLIIFTQLSNFPIEGQGYETASTNESVKKNFPLEKWYTTPSADNAKEYKSTTETSTESKNGSEPHVDDIVRNSIDGTSTRLDDFQNKNNTHRSRTISPTNKMPNGSECDCNYYLKNTKNLCPSSSDPTNHTCNYSSGGTKANETSNRLSRSVRSSQKCFAVSCETLIPDVKIHWSFECNEKTCQEYIECCKSTNQPTSNLPIPNEIQVRTYLNDNDVFMVISCPSEYKNEVIKKYCEIFQTDLFHDVWLMTPVSDSVTKKMYKNVFCAVCNGRSMETIQFVNMYLSCSDNKIQDDPLQSNEEDDGLLITRLYPRKTGYWHYGFKNKPIEDSFCFLHTSGLSKDRLISIITETTSTESPDCKKLCERMTKPRLSSPPNGTNNTLYKHSSSESSANHFIKNLQLLSPTEPSLHKIMLNLNDKRVRSPQFSRCPELRPQNQELYNVLCIADGRAKCTLRLVDCTENKYYLLSDTRFNDSRIADYERYVINNTHGYVCGPKVIDSIKDTHKYIEVILTILLFLVRMAVMGLFIQGLIFLWLPAKSTLDKNLGALGLTLLIQNLCLVYDRKRNLISCRIVASIWHYTMLGSFTWVLIFSYDCWLSLHQLFQAYQLVGEYDRMQFFIYFAVSQIIPGLVTGAALIFGLSPAIWYCQEDLGLDRYECLISQVPGFTLFFIIPASLLFVLNIYFLVRVGCLVFPGHLYLKEARQKFKQRSGFAMMMSPTWMLGSLLILSHFELPICDMMIFIVHILQAFFFLVYSFKQWLDRMMQKFEEIELHLFGEDVYCPMSTSVLQTEDRQLLDVLEGRQSDESDNQNVYV